MLEWSKASFTSRTELLPVDQFSAEHRANPGQLKLLGDKSIVLEFAIDGPTVEVMFRQTLTGNSNRLEEQQAPVEESASLAVPVTTNCRLWAGWAGQQVRV
jgi:hypothetical protein